MRHVQIVLIAALAIVAGQARPAEPETAAAGAQPQPKAGAPPSAPAPSEAPPPPPAQVEPPVKTAPRVAQGAQPVAAEPQPAPAGNWVYTQRYGWLWMPYGDTYWYAPRAGVGEPYEYVYYPSRGWVWVSAPWIWGIGPWPSFGVVAPVRFGWYAYGWWRTPARFVYRPVAVRPGVVVVRRPVAVYRAPRVRVR